VKIERGKRLLGSGNSISGLLYQDDALNSFGTLVRWGIVRGVAETGLRSEEA
jgi:hypothetical protein